MAMIDTSQFTLFGFDLTQIAAWLRLAYRQLLWDENAYLKTNFYPEITIIDPDSERSVDQSNPSVTEGERFGAVIIAASQVLSRSLSLPAVTELYLEDAVALDVMSHCPFPSEDVVFGWRIARRDSDQVIVEWGLVAKSAVQSSLRELGFEPQHDQDLPEVWAELEAGRSVLLSGYGEARRRTVYTKRLQSIALQAVAVWMLSLAMLASVSLYARLQNTELEQRLAEVAAEAEGVTSVRERLASGRELLNVATIFSSERVPVRDRLHALAKLSPDSVYLQRLELKGNSAAITGLATNAADYLATLAESDQFAGLEATSAFTRDRQTSLERFTIDIQYDGEATDD